MKMTLHIDEALLDRVTAIYGCESKTAAVALALGELERRHKLKSYADRGLGFTPGELRESLDPSYDLMASRYGAGGPAAAPVIPADPKPHGRRRAR
ncbi:MAG: type II toxin-antitoxin system VapB family antitoxin [Verrucomicrobia bacterium]|nr:type II toxin-antitoxin system VapB family antitoxin [Verrucomicrobiota bacterium]